MTLTFSPWRAVVMTQIKDSGQLSQKPEWKQMDTTDYTNFPLTQSEKISNWNWKRFWLGNLKFLVSFVNSGKLAGWSHPDFDRSSYSENCAYYNRILWQLTCAHHCLICRERRVVECSDISQFVLHWSHSVTCHPAEMTFPPTYPAYTAV